MYLVKENLKKNKKKKINNVFVFITSRNTYQTDDVLIPLRCLNNVCYEKTDTLLLLYTEAKVYQFFRNRRYCFLFEFLPAAEQYQKRSHFLDISKKSKQIKTSPFLEKGIVSGMSFLDGRNVNASLQLFRPHGSLKFFIHSLD